MNRKLFLGQSKPSVDVNNYEHPITTLAKTFLNNEGEVNPYLQLGYNP